MTGLKEARREFWDAWNGLSQVHTQEALETQSEKMWAARKRLMKVDPEFRDLIKNRADKANAEAETQRKQIKTKHETLTSEAEAESKSIIKANAAMRMSEEELDEWAQKHMFKNRTPEEAKTKSKLVCPICHKPDMGNLVNGEPGCIQCNHILVPESELKNYNREYRRRWNRSRKKH